MVLRVKFIEEVKEGMLCKHVYEEKQSPQGGYLVNSEFRVGAVDVTGRRVNFGRSPGSTEWRYDLVKFSNYLIPVRDPDLYLKTSLQALLAILGANPDTNDDVHSLLVELEI